MLFFSGVQTFSSHTVFLNCAELGYLVNINMKDDDIPCNWDDRDFSTDSGRHYSSLGKTVDIACLLSRQAIFLHYY